MNIAYRENISMPHQDDAPYLHLEARPMTGGLGAELFGVDLGSALDDDVIAEIRRALLQYQVIFFRDQEMTPKQHRDFGKRFGELHIHEYVKGLDAVPEVMPVIKTATDTFNFGGTWHSDVTYHTTPPLGSILYALEAPEVGGDTVFANQYLAYETLSDGMKELLEGRKAVHSAEPIYGKTGAFSSRYKQGSSMAAKPVEAVLESQHPIFRTHPETGRKSLYVNGNFVVSLAGLPAIESAPILQRLYQHATAPEFCCRFRWRKGSVAFWDNRCVQHYAVNDYTGQRRVMHRVTVMGDQPY
jgi:taurine dioxygenase